ncbi:NF038396 family protein [Micrococcus sp.]|uniref:NF038396 family protein n=1 Tax=Micrococcus sp. TaxID=1271 RepID=UPI002A912249|nr:NF038396 family protein [Micrococcus sp.]MDY6055611.1 NF038396 family protein [Micrococcus sp.]
MSAPNRSHRDEARRNADETETRSPRGAGLIDAQAVAFLALVAFPVLAFVCAVMGLVLVLQGKTVAGLVFLLVLTQVFAVAGLMTWARRRRSRQDAADGR